MIIRHSNKILEQLSEIEKVISKFEAYIDSSGLEIDKEKLLLKLIKAQETKLASRVNRNED